MIEIHPLTPDRWQDFETLFGAHGAYGGCWCMFWREPSKEYAGLRGEPNHSLMKGLVSSGTEPGLLAYVDGKAAGWVAVAPRSEYIALARSRVLAQVDEQPVWSVTCFYIGKGFRRQGLTVALLKAACQFAAQRGAKTIEGYPTDPRGKKSVDAFVFTGLFSAFLKAGFVEVLRRAEKRPIMRYFVE